MSDNYFSYPGTELAVFADAKNWRQYWQSQIVHFIKGHVLEVGAGIGSVTHSFLYTKDTLKWVAIEPDDTLFALLQCRFSNDSASQYEFRKCTLEEMPPEEHFDTIIYIDVLEHIMDDRAELLRASDHLNKEGTLIVLVPAHQCLYSNFDSAIGHYRRYTAKSINKICPNCLKITQLKYYDSVGMFISLANRLFLRASNPTRGQISFWDSRIIPISKIMDRIFNFRIGKSLIAVFEKQ
jgi:ubiquinone/menaquinone biosynthesis C-methylase UbiE